jgi:hypothetical protein
MFFPHSSLAPARHNLGGFGMVRRSGSPADSKTAALGCKAPIQVAGQPLKPDRRMINTGFRHLASVASGLAQIGTM